MRTYIDIIKDLKSVGLNHKFISSTIGVSNRQIGNWLSGRSFPKDKNRDNLLELDYINKLLLEIYTPEGSEIWLYGRKRTLNGKKPIDLLSEKRFDDVILMIERINK